MYLVACEHLIDEFLQQHREIKTEPVYPVYEEPQNEIDMDSEPSQLDQFGMEMKAEPEMLDNVLLEVDEEMHLARNNSTEDKPHQISLQELTSQDSRKEVNMEGDTCLPTRLNYDNNVTVCFQDNDTF